MLGMLKGLGGWFINPRKWKMHAVVVVIALAVHSIMHYATFIPFLRPYVIDIPYFRLHVLHEAEFLVIVAYAGVVLGLRAGVVTLIVTGITSIPFIFYPLIIGLEPRPGQIQELALQVGIILVMGFLMILLYDRDQRRRQVESKIAHLEETDRLKTNFVSIASHELRTPLTSLYGYSELLVSRDVAEEQRRMWLENIHVESKRLALILDDLLDVSRIQAGMVVMRREMVQVLPMVEASLLAVSGMQDGHQVMLSVPPDLPEVAVDPDKLMQVLVNLVSNAFKYSPNGGHVTVEANQELGSGKVIISITDQGVGIAQEDLGNLFNSFSRIKRPETQQIQGTGLGLYIVKALVELLDGEVWVESEAGKGSTFSFSLPTRLAEAPEGAAVPASRQGAANGFNPFSRS